MQVILKDVSSASAEELAALSVQDGILIGMSGFNSFPVGEEGELVGDVGALVDYRFKRRGFAVETLAAVFEYGFVELGVQRMSLDTAAENKPWRELMRSMGLGKVESLRTGEDLREFGEVEYGFDSEMWESAKDEMRRSGRWYL